MRLGIDIDGVMTDFASFFDEKTAKFQVDNGLEIVNLGYYNLEVNYGFADPTTWELKPEMVELHKKWKKDIFKQYTTTCNPRPTIASALLHLLNEGHEVFIISSRFAAYNTDNREKAEALTEGFLIINGIPHNKLIHTEDKASVCEAYGIDIMLDDCCEVLAELGKNTTPVLFLAPYNCKSQNFYKSVRTPYEFVALVEQLDQEQK